MSSRYGQNFAKSVTPLAYGETVQLGQTQISWRLLVMFGKCAIVDHQGQRLVAAGDYKARQQTRPASLKSCLVMCLLLKRLSRPVFRHPPQEAEIEKLCKRNICFLNAPFWSVPMRWVKAQRIIAMLRQAGYNQPIYIHGALQKLCDLYERHGVELGPLRPASAERLVKHNPNWLARL